MNEKGFTLMEIAVITAILALMSAIAIPNMIKYRENARLRAAASEMLATFRKAQITAAKRNYNVCLIFDSVAGSATVFLDDGSGGTAGNGLREGSEPILEVFQLPVATKFSAVTFGGNPGFTPRGLPANGNSGFLQILPSSSSKVAYKIVMSVAGHTKIESSTDGGLHFY